MIDTNQHSKYIDKRIEQFKKSNKWNTKIVNTPHEDFARDFGSCLFTNLIRDTFTLSYMKNFKCGGTNKECGKDVQERCHGINEDRPELIRRALKKVYPDITKEIILRDIVIAFLEEHKTTKFTFKCKQCHKDERKIEKEKI